MKGWEPTSSVCPSKPGNQTYLAGYPGFCWDFPAAPEKFEKKVCAHFWPLYSSSFLLAVEFFCLQSV